MCFGRKWRSAGGDDAEAYTSQARRRGRAAAGHRDASTRALSVAVCLDVAAQRRRSPKVMRAFASAHRRIGREISGGTHQPDDVHVLIVAVFPWCSQPRARLAAGGARRQRPISVQAAANRRAPAGVGSRLGGRARGRGPAGVGSPGATQDQPGGRSASASERATTRVRFGGARQASFLTYTALPASPRFRRLPESILPPVFSDSFVIALRILPVGLFGLLRSWFCLSALSPVSLFSSRQCTGWASFFRSVDA